MGIFNKEKKHEQKEWTGLMAHLGIEMKNDSPKITCRDGRDMYRTNVFMECVEKLRVHCLNIGLEKALDCEV